jgi:hypothetical protein
MPSSKPIKSGKIYEKPTEPKDDYITVGEISQAWENWLTFHKGIHCEETEERFFTYCHSIEQSFVDDLLDWSVVDDERPEDGDKRHVAANTASRIRLAASHHFNAILNAYYIKHPWK